jgi:hypothetical protein
MAHRALQPHSASAWALVSQVGFAVGILVCVALHPGVVLKRNEGGLSNYGTYAKTVAPYTFAFGIAAYGAIRSSMMLAKDADAVRVQRVERRYAVLMVLTALSTYGYKLTTSLRLVHVVVAAILVAFATISTIQMFVIDGRRRRDFWFVVIQCCGCALAGATLIGFTHLLFLAECLTSVGFGVLLVHSTTLCDVRTIRSE